MLERLFGTREPDYEPDDDVDPNALRVFNMVLQMSKERDRLRDENTGLREACSDLRRARDFYREKVGEAEYQRNFYQRHYVALHARVTDLKSNLAGAMSDAASEADANGVPGSVNLDEIERNIRDLAHSADRPDEQSAGRELQSHQLEEPKV